MSFDLFTHIGESNKEKLANWQQCLEQAGIVCRIPSELDFSDSKSEISISCKLYPPLAEEGTYVDDCVFLIEPMPVDKDNINDLIENTDDVVLIQKLKKTQYDVTINTFDENGAVAAKLICFVSAALANAFDGVLFDPQQYGGVYGTKVYDVARYYAEYNPKPQSFKKPIRPKPKEKSTVLVGSAFIIIFIIVLLNVLKKL